MPWFRTMVGGDEVLQVYDADPAGTLHPDIPVHQTDVAGVAPGWSWDGTTVAPAIESAVSHDDLIRHAAIVRYRVETTGATISGRRIATDRESRALIDRLATWLGRNADVASVAFKALDGWASIPRADMLALPDALEARTQACFAAEQTVVAAIVAGTITTYAAVEAASWPA